LGLRKVNRLFNIQRYQSSTNQIWIPICYRLQTWITIISIYFVFLNSIILIQNDTLTKAIMKQEELEAKVKTLSETIAKLEAKLTRMENIESIKKLQRAYGYYLEHWQEDQILDLWSHRDDVSVQTGRSGQFKGWEQVRNSFDFEDQYTAYNGAK